MTRAARRAAILSLLVAALAGPARADDPVLIPVLIEDMTWPEIAARMEAGATTIILPTGGTEQNGPHMVLGKHNAIVRYAAGEIARRLGDALVAPVLAYVPEGGWDPPQGHMRFPGSISLPDAVYAGVLESAARGFAAQGFKTVLFLGDSGGNQAPQAAVAQKLDAELKPRGIRVFQVGDYYARNGQVEWLKSQGFTAAEIGVHAALIDTAQLLAIDPDGVRSSLLSTSAGDPDGSRNGVIGDPAKATPALGRALLELKIEAAVRQTRQEVGAIP